MISPHFTEEEQRSFFERAGYIVSLREYTRVEKITHGWYEKETYEELSVKVGDKWRKMAPLFEEVMDLKLKLFLLGRKVDDNMLIREITTDNER